MPNIKELESITSDTSYNPAIDNLFFTGAHASYEYWSSTTDAYDPSIAWLLYFFTGEEDYYNKYLSYYVRCVRGGTALSQTWNVTPSAGTNGSISPNTVQTVNNGATKSFTVTPNAGYKATMGGTCGGSPASGTAQFTYTTNAVTSDCTVTAAFTSNTLFEETDTSIQYTGVWTNYPCTACSGGAVKYSGQSGAKASLTFTGKGIKWIAAKTNQLGKTKVYVDNALQTTVDLYSSKQLAKQLVYQKTGLTNSSHTIRIEFTGTKNVLSKGTIVDLDAFEVVP